MDHNLEEKKDFHFYIGISKSKSWLQFVCKIRKNLTLNIKFFYLLEPTFDNLNVLH